VGVDVQGHRHGGVAEAFADDLGVHACLEGQGGVGVAQVVEADLGQPGPVDAAFEAAAAWPSTGCHPLTSSRVPGAFGRPPLGTVGVGVGP
jgi:formaldehyde-activating enzyme involved in methanogenesis